MNARVQASDLNTLRAETARRDGYAVALGQAMVEYELERVRIAGLDSHLEQLQRLGALQHEFDLIRDRQMASVIRSLGVQKEAGEAAMRRLGLDPNARTLTIDLASGDVLELQKGAWVPVALEVEA